MQQTDLNNEIVICQSEDGKTQLDVKLYAKAELYRNNTCYILEHVDNEGKQRTEALLVMP